MRGRGLQKKSIKVVFGFGRLKVQFYEIKVIDITVEFLAYFPGNINADLLCLLQQQLGHGTTLSHLQRTENHQYKLLNRVINSSKTKIVCLKFPSFT